MVAALLATLLRLQVELLMVVALLAELPRLQAALLAELPRPQAALLAAPALPKELGLPEALA